MSPQKSAGLVVIEADERTRWAAEVWLRREGYNGRCLPDARTAVRFLEARRPPYSVLDLTTLAGEGLDVLRTITTSPRLRDLAMVVHVATPDGEGGFRSRAFLTRGIDWPQMHAESDRYVH